MAKKPNTEIEKLIEDITVDCYGEDEQLSAFEVVINDAIDKHAKVLHLNEPVYLVAVNFDKGLYAGLRARLPVRAKSLKCRCLTWRLIASKMKNSIVWSMPTDISLRIWVEKRKEQAMNSAKLTIEEKHR